MTPRETDIRKLVPHAGDMCLLDEVVDWTPEGIHCRSLSHLRSDHPLRWNGRLHALNGIEYGAQAAAVHGGLLAGYEAATALAVIAAVKDVEILSDTLDDTTVALEVRADRLLEMGGSMIYGFEVSAGARPIVRGRLTVMEPNT